MSFSIFPAIDLRNGRVVRLKEGDPQRLTSYSDDPAAIAQRWLDSGARWLHVVNLDGAFGESDSANRSALVKLLKLGGQVQFGGGLRSREAIERTLSLGVQRIVLGTLAAEQPQLVEQVLERFGAERIVVGIDARDGLVRLRGWQDGSAIAAWDLALQMRSMGVRTMIFTDVSRDGMGSGLNISAAQKLAELSGLEVVASGGAHTIGDVKAAREAGLAGVILGRALYEGTIDLNEALEIE